MISLDHEWIQEQTALYVLGSVFMNKYDFKDGSLFTITFDGGKAI
jgi:hypothetical protein